MPDNKKKAAAATSELDELEKNAVAIGGASASDGLDELEKNAVELTPAPDVQKKNSTGSVDASQSSSTSSPSISTQDKALPAAAQDLIDLSQGKNKIIEEFPQYAYTPAEPTPDEIKMKIKERDAKAAEHLTNDILRTAQSGAVPDYAHNLSTVPFTQPGSVVYDITDVHGDPQHTGDYVKYGTEKLRLDHSNELAQQSTQDPEYQKKVDEINARYKDQMEGLNKAGGHIVDLQIAYGEMSKQGPTPADRKNALSIADVTAKDPQGYSHQKEAEALMQSRKEAAQTMLSEKLNPLVMGMRQQVLLGNKQAQDDYNKFVNGKPITPAAKYAYEKAGYGIMQEGANSAMANGNEEVAAELHKHFSNPEERLQRDNKEYLTEVYSNLIGRHIYNQNQNPIHDLFFRHHDLSQKEVEDAAKEIGLTKAQIADVKPEGVPRSPGAIREAIQSAHNTFFFTDEDDPRSKMITGEVPDEYHDFRNPRGFLGHLAGGAGMVAGFVGQARAIGGALAETKVLGDVAANAARYSTLANRVSLAATNYSSAYHDAEKLFGDSDDNEIKRQSYAVVNSLIGTALMEGIGGNPITLGEKAFGTKAGQDYIKRIKAGGLEDLTKAETQSYLEKMIQQATVAGEHTAKMAGTMGAVQMAKNITDQVYDPKGKHGIMDNVEEAAISGGISMLIPSIVAGINAPKTQNSLNRSLMYEVGQKPYEYKKAVTEMYEKRDMTEEASNKAIQTIDRMQHIVQNQVPEDKITGQKLTEEEKQRYAWNMLKNSELTDKLQKAEASKDAAQIDATENAIGDLVKERTDMLSGDTPERKPFFKPFQKKEKASETHQDIVEELQTRVRKAEGIKADEDADAMDTAELDRIEGDTKGYIESTIDHYKREIDNPEEGADVKWYKRQLSYYESALSRLAEATAGKDKKVSDNKNNDISLSPLNTKTEKNENSVQESDGSEGSRRQGQGTSGESQENGEIGPEAGQGRVLKPAEAEEESKGSLPTPLTAFEEIGKEEGHFTGEDEVATPIADNPQEKTQESTTFTRKDALEVLPEDTEVFGGKKADGKSEYFIPEKISQHFKDGDEVEFFAEKKRKGVWDNGMIRDENGNKWGVTAILSDENGYIKKGEPVAENVDIPKPEKIENDASAQSKEQIQKGDTEGGIEEHARAEQAGGEEPAAEAKDSNSLQRGEGGQEAEVKPAPKHDVIHTPKGSFVKLSENVKPGDVIKVEKGGKAKIYKVEPTPVIRSANKEVIGRHRLKEVTNAPKFDFQTYNAKKKALEESGFEPHTLEEAVLLHIFGGGKFKGGTKERPRIEKHLSTKSGTEENEAARNQWVEFPDDKKKSGNAADADQFGYDFNENGGNNEGEIGEILSQYSTKSQILNRLHELMEQRKAAEEGKNPKQDIVSFEVVDSETGEVEHVEFDANDPELDYKLARFWGVPEGEVPAAFTEEGHPIFEQGLEQQAAISDRKYSTAEIDVLDELVQSSLDENGKINEDKFVEGALKIINSGGEFSTGFMDMLREVSPFPEGDENVQLINKFRNLVSEYGKQKHTTHAEGENNGTAEGAEGQGGTQAIEPDKNAPPGGSAGQGQPANEAEQAPAVAEKPLAEQIQEKKVAIIHKEAELSRQRKIRDDAEVAYNKALRSKDDAKLSDAAKKFQDAQDLVSKKEKALAELHKAHDELTNKAEADNSYHKEVSGIEKEVERLNTQRTQLQADLDKLNSRKKELEGNDVADPYLNGINSRLISEKEAELQTNQNAISEQQANLADVKNTITRQEPLTEAQSKIFVDNISGFNALDQRGKEAAYVKLKQTVSDLETQIREHAESGVAMADMPNDIVDSYKAAKETLKAVDNNEKFQKERSKTLADKIRSAKKEYKPGEKLTYGIPLPLPPGTIERIGYKVYNAAIELAARAVEAGQSIRYAIDAAIRHINDNAINESHELTAQEEADMRKDLGYHLPTPNLTAEELRGAKELNQPLSDKYRAEADKLVDAIKTNTTSLKDALHAVNSLRLTDGIKQKLREYITWRTKEEIFKGEGEEVGKHELSNAGGDFDKALASLDLNSQNQLLSMMSPAEAQNIIDKTAAARAYILKEKVKAGVQSGQITPEYEYPIAQEDPNNPKFEPQKKRFRGNAYENLFDVMSAGENAVQTPGAKIRKGNNFVEKKRLQKSKVENAITKLRDYLGYDKEKKDSFFGRMKADNVDLNKFGLWLYAKHAPERNAQNAKDRVAKFDAKIEDLTNKIANAESDATKAKLQTQLDKIIDQKDPEYALMPDGGSGMTDQQAHEILDEAEKDGMTDTYDKYGTEFRENVIKASLDKMFEGNLIDQETYDKLMGHYEHYVPLRIGEDVYNRGDLRDNQNDRTIGETLKRLFGIDPNKNPKDPQTFAETKTTGRNLYRSKGAIQYGFAERNNPLMQAIHNYEQTIKKAEQNKADIAFANFWRDNPNPDYVDVKPARYDVVKDKEGNVVEVNEDFREQPKNSFAFYENGQKKYLVVNDPGMRKMFEKLPHNVVVDMGNKVSALVRGVNTVRSPYFIIKNAIFDPQDAIGNMAINKEENPHLLSQYRKNLLGTFKDMVTNPKESIAEWKKWEEDWKAHGGKISFFNPENFVKKVEEAHKLYGHYGKMTPKKAAMFIPDRIGDFASWIENSTRIQVYRASVEGMARKIADQQGISMDMAMDKVDRDHAAVVSRNATVDFERKGKYGTWINAWKAFVNAGLQGNVNLIHGIAKNPAMAGKVLGGLALAGLMQTEVGRMLGDCDEETNPDCYRNIDESDKQKYWLFSKKMFGGSGYIKVPIGRQFGWLNYLGVKTDELMHGEIDGGKFTGEVMGALLDYYNPTGGTKETIEQRVAGNLAPIEAANQNKNIFGAPITPENQPGQFDADTYFPSTPQGWVDAAHDLHKLTGGDAEHEGLIEVSPNTLQFIYQNALGGIGKFLSDVNTTTSNLVTGEETKTKQIPFVNQFSQVSNNTNMKGEYSDLMDKLKKGDANQEERSGIMSRMMEINDLLLNNGDISPMQKATRTMRMQKFAEGDIKQEVLRRQKENDDEE